MKIKRDVLKDFAKGIVVFNNESYVRLIEYQKLQEENEQFAKRICELQSDLSKAKSQIEKMICCENCKYYDKPFCRGRNAEDSSFCFNFEKWKLAE